VIAIVDYGVGNVRSVERALAHAGAYPLLISDPDQLDDADGIVLPGVGAFAPALDNLTASGLGERVVELARRGTPILGICLGYQLLFDESLEHGRHQGLGLLPGTVREVDNSDLLPVIGWCRVTQTDHTPLWDGIADG
jgi:glutamine amidotransferase